MIGYYNNNGQMGNYMVVNELWKSIFMKRSHFKQFLEYMLKEKKLKSITKWLWYVGKIRLDK